jgi:hypothetical protein
MPAAVKGALKAEFWDLGAAFRLVMDGTEDPTGERFEHG